MAKAEISVAVEKAVHSAFAELAQNIADNHGIKVNSVTFGWLDMSTAPEQKLLVAETNVDTNCKAQR